MRSRIIRPPYRPSWPVLVELRDHGGPVVTMADGTTRTFTFEADMLTAYGWTWGEVRTWAEDDEGQRGGWSVG